MEPTPAGRSPRSSKPPGLLEGPPIRPRSPSPLGEICSPGRSPGFQGFQLAAGRPALLDLKQCPERRKPAGCEGDWLDILGLPPKLITLV